MLDAKGEEFIEYTENTWNLPGFEGISPLDQEEGPKKLLRPLYRIEQIPNAQRINAFWKEGVKGFALYGGGLISLGVISAGLVLFVNTLLAKGR